jgi:hypothetical protein
MRADPIYRGEHFKFQGSGFMTTTGLQKTSYALLVALVLYVAVVGG